MKKIKRIITTIAAASTSLITAASLNVTSVNADNTGYTYIPLMVVLEKQQLALCPEETFHFTVNPSTVTSGTTDNAGNIITTGVTGGALFASGADSISFAPDLEYDVTTTKAESESSTKISLDVNAFSSPGVYRYEVKEVKGTQEGIHYDDTTVYADLYVIYKDGDASNGLTIKNVITSKYVDGTLQKISSYAGKITFTNQSLQSATLDTECVHNFSFTEKVISESGIYDEDKKFNMTVLITRTAEDPDKEYSLVYGDISADPTDAELANLPATTIKAGETKTIEVTKDQTVTVYGLSKSDKYKVTHEGTDNYAIKFHNGNFNAYGSPNDSGTMTMGIENNSFNFTAKKQMVIPTGLFTDSMPFIFLAICAAAFGFVMFRNNHKERY